LFFFFFFVGFFFFILFICVFNKLILIIFLFFFFLLNYHKQHKNKTNKNQQKKKKKTRQNMAQELVEETMKDVGKFMAAFGIAYTTELLNSKIEGAIEDVIKGIMPEEEEKANAEKSLEDKANDVKPIAAGCMLLSYKDAWGPDKVEHRYFDMACWSIKPKDSVVVNVTFRHRQLLNLYNSMKKRIPEVTEAPFPQKKWIGKKIMPIMLSDFQFYKSTMR
jgi:heme/copper-type cytochrome/quinol oxidase subunit 2